MKTVSAILRNFLIHSGVSCLLVYPDLDVMTVPETGGREVKMTGESQTSKQAAGEDVRRGGPVEGKTTI